MIQKESSSRKNHLALIRKDSERLRKHREDSLKFRTIRKDSERLILE